VATLVTAFTGVLNYTSYAKVTALSGFIAVVAQTVGEGASLCAYIGH